MDQIIDLTQDGRHLARDRGFLTVSEGGKRIARVPLDQVAAVLAHAHGITWSNALLAALAEQGTPVVICGSNHRPTGLLWSMEGHHQQGARIRAQWSAPVPLVKGAWKAIVIAKIGIQAASLEAIGQPSAPLRMMARRVRSGDTGNIEAQAARLYWPLMMGPDFRRNTDGSGINALLNYGYTVLRAATARAVAGAGLHPAIGIFHANRGNAFALADDLMEPFRPFIDMTVREIVRREGTDVTPSAKAALARLIALDLPLADETTPLATVLGRLASSLARSFETRRLALALPGLPSIDTFRALGS
ncbi:type II CRISPR-associated endonuclease Cas1 [Haematospirillum sp. 15-248]|uniref:type II CRISPR-associated endonuclease Cas1 n=1 Tax=Haematospirillum sp. 15-248 TaxID=2723107 RepID=UPI00143AE991|nr:type II CRISPR-associated endonuclease Cas1 [Haematospirillum sp. 15-248]NKD88668.1 type II CRISPR-associated endonuclease Cas1 [Haematospirillum sp. 15-248]